jgi:arylformamidase
VVGADEPDQFRRQSSAFADAWGGSVTRLTTHVAKGRDHFDILDELTTPDSPTFRALVEMTA